MDSYRRISKLRFKRISAIGGANFGKAERISEASSELSIKDKGGIV